MDTTPSRKRNQAVLTLLAGPSGVGKDAALTELRLRNGTRHFPITATTRPMRPGEIQGKEYQFTNKETFIQMEQEGMFLETAVVHQHRYGTPRAEVETPLQENQDVVLKIDVQGAARMMELYPSALDIFIMPEGIGQLRKRLEQRTETSGIQARLETAATEIIESRRFSKRIVNHEGRLQETVDQIERAIQEHRTGIGQRMGQGMGQERSRKWY